MTTTTDKKKSKTNKTAKRALGNTKQELETLANRILTAAAPVPALPAAAVASASSAANHPRSHRVIKLGMDVHLDRYVVVRQIEGGAPQPPQRFSPAQFLEWARKQTELADQVYSCYEAGPFGYSLHRKLTGLKITHYVVRPRDWDELCRLTPLPANASTSPNQTSSASR